MAGQVLLILFGVFTMTMADYGYAPVLPKLNIKRAGPSKTHHWVGYTRHIPRTIPRPPLLYKWNPYSDPLYTAFWVSGLPKSPKHIPTHVDVHIKDDIPHGFGPPKDIVSHHVVHHDDSHENFIHDFGGPSHSHGGFVPSGPSHNHFDSHSFDSFHDSSNSIVHTDGNIGKDLGISHSVKAPQTHLNVPNIPVIIHDDSVEHISTQSFQPSPGHHSGSSFVQPGHLVHAVEVSSEELSSFQVQNQGADVNNFHVQNPGVDIHNFQAQNQGADINNFHVQNQGVDINNFQVQNQGANVNHFESNQVAGVNSQPSVVPLVTLPKSAAPLPLENENSKTSPFQNENLDTNSIVDFNVHIKRDS